MRALVAALASVAERDGLRNDDQATAVHLEILAKAELGKVNEALGVKILNRNC